MRTGAKTRVGSAASRIDQTIGGGFRGGSERAARRAAENCRAGRAPCGEMSALNAGSAPAAAVQALRQAAMLELPSGQHGHGFESSDCGIDSAQGISAAAEPEWRWLVPATKGADSNACPATST